MPSRAADYAALIFAVHPLQTEAVNYVWARANLLMTTLCLLALREWLRDRGWCAVAWFGLALLAKQECVALPVLLLFERRKYASAMVRPAKTCCSSR
jgi:protein O-mannosyl-transferase